jgi:hypothetical protein
MRNVPTSVRETDNAATRRCDAAALGAVSAGWAVVGAGVVPTPALRERDSQCRWMGMVLGSARGSQQQVEAAAHAAGLLEPGKVAVGRKHIHGGAENGRNIGACRHR